MERRKFLALTPTLTAIIASCSSFLSQKKQTIICLGQDYPQKWGGRDGTNFYYLFELNSGEKIVLGIEFEEVNKYKPGDCLEITLNKQFDYPYDKEITLYKIKEKIN